jgi:hypothetical protein
MKKITCLLFVFIGVLSPMISSAQCVAPINLNTTYANNETSMTWNNVSGAISYQIEIKPSFESSWLYPEIVDVVNTNSYVITDLMHSLSIDWRVKSICASGDSDYTETTFSMPCPEPSALTASAITTSSATISWTAAAGYDTYVSDFVAAYRVLGSNGAWISLGHTQGFSKVITGLLPNTTYEYCVNQSCVYFNSNPVFGQFTTASPCLSYGNNTSEWIDIFKFGTINRVSGAEPGGYTNTGLSTNLIAGNSYAARISAGFSGAVRNQKFCVYLDLNNDGSFSGTGELIAGPINITNANNKNFTLNIPSTAVAGATKLRVIMIKNNSGTFNGCATGFLGETEDYNVVISSPSAKLVATSTLSKNSNKVILYPNPTQSAFEIQTDVSIEKVEVYSLQGQLVKSFEAQNRYDITDLSKGMYLVKVNTAEGSLSKSLIIE